MEIVVKVDWIEKNFVASIASKDLGAVIVTDKTEQGVKNKLAEAFDFHTEGKFAGVKRSEELNSFTNTLFRQNFKLHYNTRPSLY